MSRNGLPSLYVFNDCERHMYEFTHYLWQSQRDKTSEHRTDPQKPQNKDDHFMENVRRLLLYPAEYSGHGGDKAYLQQVNRGYQPMDAVAGY